MMALLFLFIFEKGALFVGVFLFVREKIVKNNEISFFQFPFYNV